MFGIKIVLSELSRLYEILKSNKKMTPEEYIKSKRREDYPGGHLCYTVSEEDALKAIETARNEGINSVWHDNNVMPECNEDCLIIDEKDEIVFCSLSYDDFDQEYAFRTETWDYSMGIIKKWAYAKELLPSAYRNDNEKLCVYPIEDNIPTNYQRYHQKL